MPSARETRTGFPVLERANGDAQLRGELGLRQVRGAARLLDAPCEFLLK